MSVHTRNDVLIVRGFTARLCRAACGLMLAASASGCIGDRAADRTLTIYQMQSTKTPSGQFEIDTSQLPADAIKSREDSGGEGMPVSQLEIDYKYRVRVVLVPVEDEE